MEPEKEDN
jgi:hypothetical protein